MRILDLTTDSTVSANTLGVEVDHLPCGRSVLPSGRSKDDPGVGYAKLALASLRARSGRYDWVLLPPLHATWTVGNSRKQVFIKAIIRGISSSPLLSTVFRWIILGSVKVCQVDNSDQLRPSEIGVKIFRPQLYLMANAPSDLVGRTLPWGNGKTLLFRIPMMMDDAAIDKLAAVSENAERPNDIFITGIYHHPQREKQLQASKILSERGRKVFELQERGFEKFSQGLASSKLCFAGQGLGYFSIRMCECVAAGAVPVLNEPDDPIDFGFLNGINAVVYPADATPEQIADAVEAILEQPQRIPEIKIQAENLMNSQNRRSALADRILSTFSSGSPVISSRHQVIAAISE